MNSTMRAIASATSTRTTDRRGERFNFLEQRGEADLELLGGRRPVAVVPLKRREDVLALHVPQWTHVL